LLVVVAIIALLISILLPSLQEAREQGKRAVCLANLRSIATACNMYASEDSVEQPIPIHEMQRVAGQEYWLWRCANWFTWGGRDAQARFYQNIRLNGKPAGYDHNGHKTYAAERRPLNKYLYASMYGNENSAGGNVGSDADNLPLYHCPSDTGYPEHPDVDDAPPTAQGIPCYDTLGTSYRASFAMLSAGYSWALSRGPWGHRISTLRDTARLVLLGEPTFFNMIGRDDGSGQSPDPVLVTGWHKRILIDNLAYVDGSARSTRADRMHTFDSDTADKMNIVNPSWLARANTWQIDCYPVPGAKIFGPVPGGTQWPYAGAQNNLR
jgi:type II secretory pathway pseudopilin PulG